MLQFSFFSVQLLVYLVLSFLFSQKKQKEEKGRKKRERGGNVSRSFQRECLPLAAGVELRKDQRKEEEEKEKRTSPSSLGVFFRDKLEPRMWNLIIYTPLRVSREMQLLRRVQGPAHQRRCSLVY